MNKSNESFEQELKKYKNEHSFCSNKNNEKESNIPNLTESEILYGDALNFENFFQKNKSIEKQLSSEIETKTIMEKNLNYMMQIMDEKNEMYKENKKLKFIFTEVKKRDGKIVQKLINQINQFGTQIQVETNSKYKTLIQKNLSKPDNSHILFQELKIKNEQLQEKEKQIVKLQEKILGKKKLDRIDCEIHQKLNEMKECNVQLGNLTEKYSILEENEKLKLFIDQLKKTDKQLIEKWMNELYRFGKRLMTEHESKYLSLKIE